MPTEILLAYLGGLFDGEGSVVVGKAHRHRLTGHKTRHYQVQLHLAMQNRAAVELFARTFDGRVTPNAGFTWRTAFSCAKAGRILEHLLPHLIVKRPQAELAIYFQSLRKPMGRRGYTLEETERDAAIHERMAELNHQDGISIRKALKQRASSARLTEAPRAG